MDCMVLNFGCVDRRLVKLAEWATQRSPSLIATISTANYYERLEWIAWRLLEHSWATHRSPSPIATISTANYYERLA